MTWVHAAATLLALLLALIALRDARRARTEAARPPAPPPPPPAPPLEDEALGRVLATEQEAREALTRRVAAVEATQREHEAVSASLPERLQERLVALESAEVQAALATEDAPISEASVSATADAPVPPREVAVLVRRALEAEGYVRIVLLPDADDPRRFLVEAERHGMTVKGTAHSGEEERVDLALRPALRAFP